MDFFKFFFGMFFVVLFLSVIAFILATFFGVLKSSPSSAVSYVGNFYGSVFKATFTFLDLSMVLMFFVALFIDIVSSYQNPQLSKAILNVMLIFGLVFLNFLVTYTFAQAYNAIGAATFFPVMTGFLVGGTKVFIFFIFLVVSTILNVRPQHSSSDSSVIDVINTYGDR